MRVHGARYLSESRLMGHRDGKRAVALLGTRVADLNRAAEAHADGEAWEGERGQAGGRVGSGRPSHVVS